MTIQAVRPAPAAAVDIDAPIDAALERVRGRAHALGGGAGVLGDAIVRAGLGGKRFRPALVVRTFQAFADQTEAPAGLCRVAAAFELLHTAFVVHDDVIDRDTMRRGIPNISGEFRARARSQGADAADAGLLGDAAAILGGDLLLHEAMRLVSLAEFEPALRVRLLDLFDDAVFVSAAGELADVENAIAPDCADTPALLRAARDKTAVYSFSAPLQAGALIAGASPEALTALADAGAALGLAFQLVDDLIGAFGSAEQAGRSPGSDLREAKRTPLIALARESGSWPRVRRVLARAHTGPVAVRNAQRALADSGARERLHALIDDTLAEVRTKAFDPALPPAAGALITELATRIEARIP